MKRVRSLEEKEMLNDQQMQKKNEEVETLKKILVANGFDLSAIKEKYDF